MNAVFPKARLKRVASVTLGKMLQSSASSGDDILAPYLRAAHLQPGGQLVELAEQPMWFSTHEMRTLQLRCEDVVMVEGGAGYGRTAYLDADMPGWGFQNSILRIRRDPTRSVGRFINYAFQAALDDGQIAVACNMATFAHFTAEKVGAFEIPVPHLAVQMKVASFLDRETAQIDAFIADQEELIGLLAERRAATISHAVTKGLDPTAPVMDSGVAWLGVVPAHWKLPRVAHLGRCSSGGSVDLGGLEPMRTVDAAYPVYGGNGHVGYGYDWNLGPGNLVIGRVGALCGNVHLIREPVWVSDNALRLRIVVDRVDQAFLAYVLAARDLNGLADRTAQPLITGGVVMAQTIPTPSLAEQRQIAVHLDNETAELDAAIADAREAIALSRERRSALVSAAVTGKIDVRDDA